MDSRSVLFVTGCFATGGIAGAYLYQLMTEKRKHGSKNRGKGSSVAADTGTEEADDLNEGLTRTKSSRQIDDAFERLARGQTNIGEEDFILAIRELDLDLEAPEIRRLFDTIDREYGNLDGQISKVKSPLITPHYFLLTSPEPPFARRSSTKQCREIRSYAQS